jgi:hypothetical protein
MRGTDLLVEVVVQALAMGGLAVRKGMLAHLIKRVSVDEHGLPQCIDTPHC